LIPRIEGTEEAPRGQALAAAGRRGGGRLEGTPRVITSLKSELDSRRFEKSHKLAPNRNLLASMNLLEIKTVMEEGRQIKPLI
jgi:hypothetical protein